MSSAESNDEGGRKLSETTLKSIAATEEASRRVRWVLLVMQATCILVFMALWHQLPFSWTNARLRIAQAVVWHFDCSARHSEAEEPLSPSELPASRHDQCHYLEGKKPFTEGEIKKAAEYIETWRFTPTQARTHLANLQRAEVERIISVRVPILGFAFDINDLGLLGGLTFIFLLMWFRFSLAREEQNVQAVFEQALPGELPGVYKLLAMSQVLTIPPAQDGRHRGFWAALPDLLMWSPAVVQLAVVVNDIATRGLGEVIASTMAIVEIAFGASAFGFLIWTTWQCRTIAKALDAHWEKAFRQKNAPKSSQKVGKPRPTQPEGGRG